MRRRLALTTAALLLFALVALLLAARNDARPPTARTAPAMVSEPPAPHRVILGTGPVTSSSFAAGGSLCRLLNETKNEHGVRCSVVATDGSIANIGALRRGDIDLGIVQSDWIHHAYHGTDLFAVDGAFEALRSLMPLFPKPLTVLAAEQSGIETLNDLRGKVVSMGPADTGERASLKLLFAELGWSPSEFTQITQHADEERQRALCSGEIDAILVAVAHPNGAIRRILQACRAHIVAAEHDTVTALGGAHPYYAPASIANATYRQGSEPVASFGVRAILLTTADLPKTVASTIARVIASNRQALRAKNPILKNFNPTQLVLPQLSTPLHQGAKEYFRKAGLL